MRATLLTPLVLALAFCVVPALGVQPEVAQLSFDRRYDNPGVLATVQQPKWIAAVEQQGGQYLDQPRSWSVPANAPEGVGRLSIVLDRKRMNEDLVATILFETSNDADFAVQLFDAQGRAVVVDLFGNLVDVGKEAVTNTFVVALSKYPTAERLVLRRVKGAITVYGLVLYPVVTEGEPNNAALEKLARVLGDPLSPENPLLQGIQQIARNGNVAIARAPAAEQVRSAPAAVAPSGPRPTYPGAVIAAPGSFSTPAPTDGLLAYWSFDNSDGTDASGRGHRGELLGAPFPVPGIRGQALNFNPGLHSCVTTSPSPDFELKDAMTVAAWVKPAAIRGGQIVWFGDRQKGRDPWLLQMIGENRVRFRSDRSVTGKADFEVQANEIVMTPSGDRILQQHVAVDSPGKLAPGQWYFVAGTIERVSARMRAFKLYLNGEPVGEAQSDETVNYPTRGMSVVLGAVDQGTWQNFGGAMDEVRVYQRALSPAEIQVLYRQPGRL